MITMKVSSYESRCFCIICSTKLKKAHFIPLFVNFTTPFGNLSEVSDTKKKKQTDDKNYGKIGREKQSKNEIPQNQKYVKNIQADEEYPSG